jgi:hypothetical protein
LLFQQQVLSNNSATTAGFDQIGGGQPTTGWIKNGERPIDDRIEHGLFQIRSQLPDSR